MNTKAIIFDLKGIESKAETLTDGFDEGDLTMAEAAEVVKLAMSATVELSLMASKAAGRIEALQGEEVTV